MVFSKCIVNQLKVLLTKINAKLSKKLKNSLKIVCYFHSVDKMYVKMKTDCDWQTELSNLLLTFMK